MHCWHLVYLFIGFVATFCVFFFWFFIVAVVSLWVPFHVKWARSGWSCVFFSFFNCIGVLNPRTAAPERLITFGHIDNRSLLRSLLCAHLCSHVFLLEFSRPAATRVPCQYRCRSTFANSNRTRDRTTGTHGQNREILGSSCPTQNWPGSKRKRRWRQGCRWCCPSGTTWYLQETSRGRETTGRETVLRCGRPVRMGS